MSSQNSNASLGLRGKLLLEAMRRNVKTNNSTNATSSTLAESLARSQTNSTLGQAEQTLRGSKRTSQPIIYRTGISAYAIRIADPYLTDQQIADQWENYCGETESEAKPSEETKQEQKPKQEEKKKISRKPSDMKIYDLKKKKNLEEELRSEDQSIGKYIFCIDCGAKAIFASSFRVQNNTSCYGLKRQYFCNQCRFCQICKFRDEGFIVECLKCFGTFHSQCIVDFKKPEPEIVDLESWFCTSCMQKGPGNREEDKQKKHFQLLDDE